MSFRVNTNVQAMNALRNLTSTSAEFSKSMTALSTGLRINSAADDPAGLIISENFRAQISGIDQAVRNNQDALNYTKTAEGALDEVNRLLRDARGLSVASGNTGTLSADQLQANQSQLNSIVNSINRIASTTQFGNKKLLDGSAGVSASVTSTGNVSSMYFSGQFNSAALTTNSVVTMTVTTSASQATIAGATIYTATSDTVAAGQLSINGYTFNTTSSTTVGDLINQINSVSAQTGVTADLTSGTGVSLTSTEYGTRGNIVLSDASGILNTAGTATATGTNAVATVSIDTNGATAGGVTTVTFTGGRGGQSGLFLTDNDGNSIKITPGASTSATAIGYASVGSAQFQVGGNANQTANLSLGNFSASQLGSGAVSGLNLSNLDITTASGATNALSVIDAAINQVAKSRGEMGSFQRNVLESNIRALGVAKENLSASESAIRDVDVAAEMSKFTKLQILQQSGLSMLAQANSAPQSVLSLLR
ncbi:MAG: hypothetical protein KF784_04310 [Fimbriimonadaceae bacterium]|nr:hypothetical protein [Fimbriimonadaceae bacterium]